MKLTGGDWDTTRWPLYFLATNPGMIKAVSLDASDNLLVAVNELTSPQARVEMEDAVARGRKVLLDSGVYWLATQHAEANRMSMNEALSLAPDQIDGFDKLLAAYVETVERYESNLWGYIEIDQGGLDNKRRTRTRLEAMGLRPMPVYHPFNDGWDYFDELAAGYDRICLGNVVMATAEQRKRLLATIWERRRRYPDLWIHVLGLTPNEVNVAYPMQSCDSSSWIGGARWAAHKVASAAQPMGDLTEGFSYARDRDSDDERGHLKAWRLGAYDAIMLGHSLRNIRSDQEHELGADPRLLDHR